MSQNREIEERLLCCAFFGPEEVNLCAAEGLTHEAFFFPQNAAIWRALVVAASEHKSTDLAIVWRYLTGLSGDSDGQRLAEIGRIQSLEPTSMHVRRFCQDVMGLWRQRRLVVALTQALKEAQGNAPSFEDVWSRVEGHIQAASNLFSVRNRRSWADIAKDAAKNIRNPDPALFCPTPYPRWDFAATPPKAGEVIVIAGRPGTGKTALAVQIADFCAKAGKHVACFSLEMDGEEYIGRIGKQRGGRDAAFDKEKWAQHIEEAGRMKTLHFYGVDDADSMAKIEAAARMLSQSPQGLGALFVDYLTLIEPPIESRKEIREQQVAQMSRRFKKLAGSLRVPIFLLAQLNRESEKEDRRPRKSDLRESGTIEQDADRVWFLYTPPSKVVHQDASKIDVMLYQCKCRNGPQGIESAFEFDRPVFTFSHHK